MVITTCQRAMKLFPPTWQHHHLMIASTTVPIIQWQLIFFLGVDQYTRANLRLDASLPPCTLRSQKEKWNGLSHHAQTPAVLDHSRTLPQGDGRAGPALAGGAERRGPPGSVPSGLRDSATRLATLTLAAFLARLRPTSPQQSSRRALRAAKRVLGFLSASLF